MAEASRRWLSHLSLPCNNSNGKLSVYSLVYIKRYIKLLSVFHVQISVHTDKTLSQDQVQLDTNQAGRTLASWMVSLTKVSSNIISFFLISSAAPDKLRIILPLSLYLPTHLNNHCLHHSSTTSHQWLTSTFDHTKSTDNLSHSIATCTDDTVSCGSVSQSLLVWILCWQIWRMKIHFGLVSYPSYVNLILPCGYKIWCHHLGDPFVIKILNEPQTHL